MAGDGDETRVSGEARLHVEGGVAHFPGRAREQAVSFDQLASPERHELRCLADEAGFFTCAPAAAGAPRPDARTYTVALTIDGRSRELRLAEPIADPALARLVSAVRRLTRREG